MVNETISINTSTEKCVIESIQIIFSLCVRAGRVRSLTSVFTSSADTSQQQVTIFELTKVDHICQKSNSRD